MKAIIAPLNEYFYNYEKYDGLNSLEKFAKRNPRFFIWLESIQKRDWVKNLFQSKPFAWFLLPLVAILTISMVIRVFINVMPKIVSNIGKKRYFKFINQELYKATDKIVDADIDIKEELTVFLRSGYKLLIYYNPNSLPKEEKKLKSFYEKLEGLKKELGVIMVFEASTDADIEKMIKELNIDVSKSYFVKGEGFDLVSAKRLEIA
jgi:hypothetical protein